MEKEHQTNVRNIKELKTYSNITNGCNILIIFIILIILLIVFTKHKNITIEMNKRIQENSNLKGEQLHILTLTKLLTNSISSLNHKSNKVGQFNELY